MPKKKVRAGSKYYPAKEQGIEEAEAKETAEELSQGMETGEEAENVYTEVGREKLTEDAEISPREEAWAEGAEQRGELGLCATCGKPLSQSKKGTIEREIDGELYWFCCDDCASKFKPGVHRK